jgi:hypothetical protein
VLDDAVEEKDGGEKVRLGMVVRLHNFEILRKEVLTEGNAGYSRQFSRHARGTGENRRRTRRQRIEGRKSQLDIVRGLKVQGHITAFARRISLQSHRSSILRSL